MVQANRRKRLLMAARRYRPARSPHIAPPNATTIHGGSFQTVSDAVCVAGSELCSVGPVGARVEAEHSRNLRAGCLAARIDPCRYSELTASLAGPYDVRGKRNGR